MRHRLALASAAVVTLVASSALAEPGAEPEKEGASEGRYPVAEAERPITLPRLVLSPEIDFDVTRAPPLGTTSLFTNVTLGASFGITDNITVRASVLPLQLTGPSGNGFHYGQTSENLGPGVGATFRFVRGDIEVGASVDANLISIEDTSGAVITPGVPVRFHATKKLRIDTGAYVPITFASIKTPGAPGGSNSANTVGVYVPVSVLYDITEPIHVGGASGFAVDDFNHAGDTSRIPVEVFAGYAVAGREGPILDIDPFFMFPGLITPGASSKTETGGYVIGLSLGGFFYF